MATTTTVKVPRSERSTRTWPLCVSRTESVGFLSVDEMQRVDAALTLVLDR